MSRVKKGFLISFFLLLMIIPLVLLSFVFVSTRENYMPKVVYAKESVPEEVFEAKYEEVNEVADFNYDEIEPFSTTAYVKASLDAKMNEPEIYTSLSIPTIGLNLPVFVGVGGNNLWLGACTYTPDQRPGANNNYILMAHNTPYRNLLFSGLRYLDLSYPNFAYIYHNGETYKYLLTEKEYVYYTDGSWLEPSDEAIITLITCEGGDGTPYRTVVRGVLVTD